MALRILTSRSVLLQAAVVILVAVMALLHPTPVDAASATKSCSASSANVYTCTYTITPGVPTGAGAWLVQTSGPGTLSAPSVVTSSSGCAPAPAVTAGGTQISPQYGVSDYNVSVTGTCSAAAVVVVTETITVTSSGSICQNIWITASMPVITACATVTYTPVPAATKTCTLTSTPNRYTCVFTVTPAFPAVAGDLIHVNEIPLGPMTGPGTIVSTPTVGAVIGCAEVPTPVTMTTATGYHAQVGPSGCPGLTWSVQFIETIDVTASGSLCQSFYMVAAVPPAGDCAAVVYTPVAAGPTATKTCTLTSTPNRYSCLFTVTPAFPAVANDLIHVNEAPGPLMTGPGTIVGTPTVANVSGCAEMPSPVVSSSATSYNAKVGPSGCPGVTWSVQFLETIDVTATGQICQSFWMVAAVPPTTVCASVTYTPSSAVAGTSKTCVLTSTPNVYTCTFTIAPGFATGPGPWLVQMVTPGPGTFTGPSVVSSTTTGCSTTPSISAGSLISPQAGLSDYNVTIGAGGCTAGASVVITETVTITASGQLCQKVWVTAASLPLTACATVELAKSLGSTGGSFSGGTIASSGVSLVAFTGSIEQLDAAGMANSPKIISVSATSNGKLLTYVVGAPSFVNTEFSTAFPNGLNSTLVIVKTG